jgi:hypothetical protein
VAITPPIGSIVASPHRALRGGEDATGLAVLADLALDRVERRVQRRAHLLLLLGGAQR